jgi:hypothetical protein
MKVRTAVLHCRNLTLGAMTDLPANDLEGQPCGPTLLAYIIAFMGFVTFGGGAEFSPGDRIKDIGVRPVPGASELAPGDRMNDTRKR